VVVVVVLKIQIHPLTLQEELVAVAKVERVMDPLLLVLSIQAAVEVALFLKATIGGLVVQAGQEL
jgi:hypothetical protein